MADRVKVTCKRCGGKGTVVHRTARFDARCFCCDGQGFYFRKAATKRQTEAERLDAFNATLSERVAAAARGELKRD